MLPHSLSAAVGPVSVENCWKLTKSVDQLAGLWSGREHVDPSVIMKRPGTAFTSRNSLELGYLTAQFSDPDQERSFRVFIEEENNLPVQRVCRVFMALAFGMVR